jgi:hypothetical protein
LETNQAGGVEGFNLNNPKIQEYIEFRKNNKTPPKWSTGEITKRGRPSINKYGNSKIQQIPIINENNNSIGINHEVVEIKKLDKLKKKADIQLVHRRIRGEDLKHDKEMGALLPIDFFVPMLSRMTKEVLGCAKEIITETFDDMLSNGEIDEAQRSEQLNKLIDRINSKDEDLQDSLTREINITINDYIEEIKLTQN